MSNSVKIDSLLYYGSVIKFVSYSGDNLTMYAHHNRYICLAQIGL